MLDLLIGWKCKSCKSITYVKQEDLLGWNMPGYCQGCGKWLEAEDVDFLGIFGVNEAKHSIIEKRNYNWREFASRHRCIYRR